MAVNTSVSRPVSRRSDSFDYMKFIRQCLKRWWWFLISFLVVGSAVGAYYVITPAPVNVKASVLIASKATDGAASLMKQFDVSSVLGGTGSVDSEVAIMSSHEVMLMTVKELQLNCNYLVKEHFYKTIKPWGDEPVQIVYDHAIADTLSVGLNFKLKIRKDRTADVTLKGKKNKTLLKEKGVTLPYTCDTPYGKFTLSPTEAFDGYFKKVGSIKETVSILNYSVAAELFQKKVLIAPVSKKVSLVNLSYSSLNSLEGVDVLEAVIRNYNILGIATQREKEQRTINFIDQRLAELSGDLDSKEADIEQYTADKGVGNFEADAKSTMERSIKLQEVLAQAETEFRIMQSVKSFLSDPENKYAFIPSIGEGLENAVSIAIKGYNEMILKRVALLNNASEDNLAVKNLDALIDVSRDNINFSLDKAIDAAALRLNELRAQTSRVRGRELNLPGTTREYLVLKRNQGIQEKLYLYLLQQREEKGMRMSIISPASETIDQVYVSALASDRSFKMYAIIILVLGLGLPMALIFLLDRLRRTVDSAAEVKSISHLPVLAEIPSGDSVSGLRWVRPLQANLGYMLGSSGGNALMVTSMGNGDGKTYVAEELACEFAAQSGSALLIVADSSDSPAAPFGLKPRVGLADYLVGKASVDEIILDVPSRQGVSVIAAAPEGVRVTDFQSLLLSPRFHALMTEVASRFDTVIIDSPAMGGTGGDACAVAAEAQVVLLVTRGGVTDISSLERVPAINASGIFRNLSAVYLDAEKA